MRAWAEAHEVPATDLDAFTDIAFGLLVDLHEGTLARNGLGPSDFTRWKGVMRTEPALNTTVRAGQGATLRGWPGVHPDMRL
jgi:hypothetical protein